MEGDVKASERVRNGFWRLALLGGLLGMAGAMVSFGLAGYNAWFERSQSVYFEGSFREVPTALSQEQARKLLLPPNLESQSASPKGSGLDGVDLLFGTNGSPKWSQAPLVKTLEERISELVSETEASRQRNITSALHASAACLIGGIIWFAAVWTLGWLIRGFLAE